MLSHRLTSALFEGQVMRPMAKQPKQISILFIVIFTAMTLASVGDARAYDKEPLKEAYLICEREDKKYKEIFKTRSYQILKNQQIYSNYLESHYAIRDYKDGRWIAKWEVADHAKSSRHFSEWNNYKNILDFLFFGKKPTETGDWWVYRLNRKTLVLTQNNFRRKTPKYWEIDERSKFPQFIFQCHISSKEEADLLKSKQMNELKKEIEEDYEKSKEREKIKNKIKKEREKEYKI